jgi:hypothetical protein
MGGHIGKIVTRMGGKKVPAGSKFLSVIQGRLDRLLGDGMEQDGAANRVRQE